MLNKMMAMLTGPKIRPEDLTFEQAREILDRASDEAKRELARVAKAPEILAYLSKDLQGDIRALVAGNTSTPREIDLDLADDVLDEVRVQLARKISRLLPGLSNREQTRIRELTIKVIERLAADSLPRVRQIVAEEIKKSGDVPKAIVLDLAKDAEIVVAAPVLEYSPLLSDDDLLEIIATSEVEGVLASIAKRDPLTDNVSEAVVATLDIPAVTALLANQNAQIRAETLDRIVEHAKNVDEWHKPLVFRPELSIRAIRRIAGFAASSLLEVLSEKHNLDDETRRMLKAKVSERLQKDDRSRAEEPKEQIWNAVSAAMQNGTLDDEYVSNAIKADDRLRVVLSLVALGRVPEATVERILKSGSAQIITALAWHCNLQMRTAFELQKSIAKIAPKALLPARNGVDFPLSREQMISQLELMGVEHKQA
ncbi:MAG: DUF2336 domain-containing protein [Alphaproteobacteria bacterium]